jgi:phosphotriesterase-related protein
VPTGNYREPWIPDWVAKASEAELRDWMLAELTGEIESSGVRAGWIKLSAGDDGITDLEARILRAAAVAGRETNAVIGSHTIKGRVVMDQLDIIERAGYDPARFISIHTQEEPDRDLHFAVARRGAWIEYDSVGRADDDRLVDMINRVLDAGFGDRLLLSHDRGWYDPAKPGGGEPVPYTHLSEVLIPKLMRSGIDEKTIIRLTHDNPFNAFAR